MDKLKVEEFEVYKKKILEILSEFENAEGELPETRAKEILEEYENALKGILGHDLSDIPASMWEGMLITSTENIELDFEGTNANLDFSVFAEFDLPRRNGFGDPPKLVNFKSCKIENFPFDTAIYAPEMFDEEFIKENESRFLSLDVPEELRTKFYEGKLTFSDLKSNQEVREKFIADQLDYAVKDIYALLSREEFLKLDFDFLEETKYWARNRLNERKNLQTAEEIMDYLYTAAKEELVNPSSVEGRDLYDHALSANLIKLGEEFRKRNPNIYISDEVPDYIKQSFYGSGLYLVQYINAIEHFKDVDMRIAFKYKEKEIHDYFGEDMYELFERYGKYIYTEKNGYYSVTINIPENPSGTIEEKRQVLADVIKSRLEREPIRDLKDVKVLSEILSVEEIVGSNKYANIITAAGIEKLEELGFENIESFKNGITDTKTIYELSKVMPNISLILPKEISFSESFTVEDAVNAGIEDVRILSKNYTQDINGAKELLDKGVPIDVISFGTQTFAVRDFIKKYGIDNLVKFEEETKIFSVEQRNGENHQLELLAIQERNMPKNSNESNEAPDYETFRSRMYDILVAARNSSPFSGRKGILTSRDFPSYSHMEGRFRDEHPEIFIDNVPEEISQNFYFGILKPEHIQRNTEVIDILKEKNLELAFSQLIQFPGLRGANGEIVGYTSESFSGYVIKNYGIDNFFKLCLDYGNLICDKTNYFEEYESSFEDFVKELEENIYKQIQKGLEYSEKVPEAFKEKYPEIFLPESVPQDIKELFYKGKLRFEHIQEHPELVEILSSKDINVGFGQLRKNNWGTITIGDTTSSYKYQDFFEKVAKDDILKLAEKYGKYLLAFKAEDLEGGYSSFEELDEKVKQSIRNGILSGKVRYSDEAPTFFKEEHPEFFLSEDAPELLKLSYYSDYRAKEEPYENHSSSNYALKIELLKEHPEYRMFLEGKRFDLVTDKWVSNLATRFSTQEILDIINIDSEAVKLLSKNTDIVDRLRRNIDERPKDRENIIRFPGYTLYYSDEKRQEFNFAEYKEIVTMSKFTVSDNYRRDTAEQILATMYDFLGYAGSKEILRLPELEEERVEEIIKTHGQAFSELYEERFKLKGNLKILNTFFDKFVPQLPGKKGSLNVYKLLNQKLEEGYNGSLEDLIFDLMNENDLEFEENKIKMVAKAAVDANTAEKLELLYENVSASIENGFEETLANKKILKDILLNTYRKSLSEYEKLDENAIRQMLTQEFSRTREDGGTFYSPHITDHLEDLIAITKNINVSPEYGPKIKKSVVDILREEKEEIGQGWIRKLLELRPELSKEELEALNQKLYGNSESEKIPNSRIVRLKDTSEIGMENAYVFLKELELPGIFTYEKGEQMFAGLSKPYSENFKNFFLKNQKEILRKPEYYTVFQRMHAEFERIINDPHINTRFKAGAYTLGELLTELNRTTYPGVKEGEYELEYVARKAGLETDYWPKAQEVYKKMLERETQSVPPVEFQGKQYRGRILRIDDPLHLVMGHITTCCQRFGNGQPGEPSMLHSALERNGSVFLVEEIDEQGRIVGSPLAQSWTWRNGDRICFDNVEIPDTLELELKAKKAYDPILTIYIETAKKMMDIDKKMLDKMLDEGKITKEQYDLFIIKEITIGTGCDDLIKNISPGLRETLKTSNTVRPIEASKSYETVSGEMKKPWIDSATQLILASNDEAKEFGAHSTYSGEVTVEYTKIREVLRREGRNISSDLIVRMKQMVERAEKTDTSLIGKLESNSVIELFYDTDDYLENENSVALSQSSNDDWYILTRTEDHSITILDSLITSGVNKIENQIPMDAKLAKYEYLNEILAIMQIAKQSDKVVKIDPEREGSFLKLDSLIENGTLILENDNIRIGNDISVKKIRESLTKEIEKAKESRILGNNPEADENSDKTDDERL